MGNDYVPRNDNELNVWLANFVPALTMNAATVGLVADDLTPITNDTDEFTSALSAYQQQEALTRAASNLKKTKRIQVVDTLRPLVQRIQKHPGMTDQLRGLLGLPTQDMVEEPLPLDQLMPLVKLDPGIGQVRVHWGPSPGNEHRNGKPAGVKGANIYRRKAGEDDYRMLAFTSSSPYIDEIVGDAADYTYVVRYRGTRATDLSEQSDAWTVAVRGEAAA